MCGIVGYVGRKQACGILLEGLRRLEYRGYDSSGTAVVGRDGSIRTTRAVGRIAALAEKLDPASCDARTGIGHTRWATHGRPSEANAHPHAGGDGSVILVHNGVVENFRELAAPLQAKGYVFRSETDTEVVAHLIADLLAKRLEAIDVRPEGSEAVDLLLDVIRSAVAQLRGTYGLLMIFRDWPEYLFAARLGSPLVIGIGHDEHYVASDASPLAGRTDKIVYLSDHQLAAISRDSLEVRHRDLSPVDHDVRQLKWDVTDVELSGYDHYMLKEIFEQPDAIRNTMRGRLNEDEGTAVFGGLNLSPKELRNIRRIVFTACGTSWHSALVGEYLFEELAQIPVEVEYASELRYRNPPMSDDTLVFAITQSGETADTLAALREMKRKGHPTLAICNVVGSSIAQEAEGGIYLHAGPEIGVASTKAYTSQCVALAMLALYFGRLRHLGYADGRRMIEQLQALPDKISEALESNEAVRRIAERYVECDNFLYLGRHFNFPTALEGALKLKEISYVHAEGYPAAEMKHGPIALVDERTPSVFVMPRGFIYDKVMSNLEEIKARGGPVIAVAEKGDDRIRKVADAVVEIPQVDEWLQPLVSIIPLQLLAYHIAVLRGCDVDKPRNLAKSVTVE
ncbi:MAG TPA: glutamine--fructose-6-phosphate transaminase (isomerizing) [Pirellulaceae bacterium]|nr:glutamine--fructose-6-phosphate transaminase (isomerizing) [Pirellulaceae bacterium]